MPMRTPEEIQARIKEIDEQLIKTPYWKRDPLLAEMYALEWALGKVSSTAHKRMNPEEPKKIIKQIVIRGKGAPKKQVA